MWKRVLAVYFSGNKTRAEMAPAAANMIPKRTAGTHLLRKAPKMAAPSGIVDGTCAEDAVS